MNIVDKIFVRPWLKVATWCKRHWVATLIILFLLWIVPPFLTAAFSVVEGIVKLVARFSGVALAVRVGNALNAGLNWLGADSRRLWWLAFGLGLFFPLLGILLSAWLFLDQFKATAQVIALPSEGAGVSTSQAESSPSEGDEPDTYTGDIDAVYSDITGFPV